MTARCSWISLVTLLGTVAASACRSPTQVAPDGYEDCTAGGAVSFTVTVVDSATNNPPSVSAQMTWHAGLSSGSAVAQVPTAGPQVAEVLNGPYGRPGTFVAKVQASGYRDWKISDIVVQQAATHCSILETTRIVAKLQRV